MIPKKLLDVARKSLLFKSIADRPLRKILEHFHIHRLDKGEYLFRAEQKSRMMYFVAEGKLRVEKLAMGVPPSRPQRPAARFRYGRARKQIAPDARLKENQPIKIASLSPGDIVGEVAMLTGERHSGQVRAMTDASVAAIGKKELDPLLRLYPRLLQNITRIEALRLRHNIVRENKNLRELGFILHLYFATPSDYLASEPNIRSALIAQKLKSLVILDKKFLKKHGGELPFLRQQVSRLLIRNPSVYLAAHAEDLAEDKLEALILMADRLVITLSESASSVTTVAELFQKAKLKGRMAGLNPYIITVHHPSLDHLVVSEIQNRLGANVKSRLRLRHDFWQSSDHRHVKIQATTIARSICGLSQGIAFGGGGARALSEIGIISVLERHSIDFDHVAGTSMGALIAALYAMGLSSREMSARFREFLPSDKGLLRYNLPFISFYRDRSVNRILRRLFGKLRIEDLPKPLTVIAADLISGQEIRLQKGLLWRAVRASMSLPVIFPPVKYHNYYLVDGGAINNVPGNALRDQGVERVLGINCTPLADSAIADYLASTNLFQLLKPGDKFWRNLKRFFKMLRIFLTRPPILQIANRAMMLEGSELIRQKSREFDLLLSPDVARYGLFEFDRREEIIDTGRYYARGHVEDLKKLFRKS